MAKEYLWTQVEPALAIFCSCLVTFRPLFTNLNLNISKYTSRFSRSKNLSSSSLSSSSKATNFTDMSNERRSYNKWPGMRDPYNQDSARLSSKGMSTKGGLHIVDTDLGTTDRNDPYTVISDSESRDGGEIWNQHHFSTTKSQEIDAGEV